MHDPQGRTMKNSGWKGALSTSCFSLTLAHCLPPPCRAACCSASAV